MQLVQKPHNYDVLVLPNLYGDIISDLCAGLIGGLGIAPGAISGMIWRYSKRCMVQLRNTQGLNKVNPTAMILSGVLMLKYLKEESAARRLEDAVKEVVLRAKR